MYYFKRRKYMKFDIKNKKIWIILSVIALLLAATIVSLVIFFSTGETLLPKKKKKVIKVIKKTDTSQTDDTSSFDDYYNVDFDADEEFISSEDETSSEDGEEKTKSPYDVDFGKVSKNAPANQQIGMMIYHYNNLGAWNDLTKGKYGDESEFLNYYHINDVIEAKKVKESGGMFWMTMTNPFPNKDRKALNFKAGWEDSLRVVLDAYKSMGIWENFAGFHTEEIMMSMSGEQFRIMTKFLRDNWPDKRIYACLSLYELNGAWPGNEMDPMTYKTYGYVTDIGFDCYHTNDYVFLKSKVNQMKEQLGRNNVRIWFYPCTYGFTENEDYMIEHLNVCYRLLLEEENPGGLDLYTWKTWSAGAVGLDRLLDPDLNYNYEKLAKRIVEIGKEIMKNPYRYNESLSSLILFNCGITEDRTIVYRLNNDR